MTIFRNNVNKNLYTLEHLVYNFKYTDGGSSLGIYAVPYFKGQGHAFKMLSRCHDTCEAFVENNFKPVAHT